MGKVSINGDELTENRIKVFWGRIFLLIFSLCGASTGSTSATLIEMVGFQWDVLFGVVENGGIL